MAQEAAEKETPALYLVATPIGNLEDISARALSVLAGVGLILAEDTRRTRKLLSYYDIHTPLRALHDHNETALAAELAAQIAAGRSMALVSDAGTPLISDPGFPLVRAALEAGVRLVPIPGASAVLAALAASGLPPDRFTFAGYLPRKRGPRRAALAELAEEPGTIVVLESPRRLAAALHDAADVLGNRPVAVARELTKVHEEFIRGTLSEVAAQLAGAEIRGEVTLCIGGRPEADSSNPVTLERSALVARFDELLAAGTARNDALRQLAREHGVGRRQVYAILFVEEQPDPHNETAETAATKTEDPTESF